MRDFVEAKENDKNPKARAQSIESSDSFSVEDSDSQDNDDYDKGKKKAKGAKDKSYSIEQLKEQIPENLQFSKDEKEALRKAVSVSLGTNHGAYITSEFGFVYTWGHNTQMQMGIKHDQE